MKAPSGRLDNNLTVEFKADPALMGSYAMVRLTGAVPPSCWANWLNNDLLDTPS